MSDALSDLLNLSNGSKEVEVVSRVQRELLSVELSAIVPNEFQPRTQFDTDELQSLAASVAELGVLQPVLLRPRGNGSFELIAGERRWRAAKLAGLATIPAVVGDYEDVDSFQQSIVENLHRTDLNPLEEARAYLQLCDDFGMTHSQIAKRVGKSRPAVVNAIRLLKLPTKVLQWVEHRKLSAGHARTVLSLDDPDLQIALAEKAIKQGLSVRALENLVRGELRERVEPKSSRAVRNFGHLEVEERFSEYLQTKVRVEGKPGKGRISIEFADTADLARIFELIVPRASH